MDTKVTFSDDKLLDIYEENDTTILDILPPIMIAAYGRVSEDIRSLEDGELLKVMRNTFNAGKVVDKRKDIRIKHALWHEYDRAMEEKRKMKIANIIKGIMVGPNFKRYLENKHRVEWIMRPPLNYWNEQRVLLEKSTMGLHEILDIPVVRYVCRCNHSCQCARKNGRWDKETRDNPCRCVEKCICPPTYDVKIAAVKHKIHEMIEMRVKGAILQRVRVDKQHLIAQVKADNLGITAENQKTAKALPTTSSGIEEELRKLRVEVKQLKGGKRQDTILDMTPENELHDTKLTT